MSLFATTVSDVIARVEEHNKRKSLLNEKLLAKYRAKVNKHLLRMKTPHISIFFKYGNVELLYLLVDELEDVSFVARMHTNDFGSHLYIDLPKGAIL